MIICKSSHCSCLYVWQMNACRNAYDNSAPKVPGNEVQDPDKPEPRSNGEKK